MSPIPSKHKPKSNYRFHSRFISMSLLTLIALITFSTLNPITHNHPLVSPCVSTRFPATCISSLSRLPPSTPLLHILQSSLNTTLQSVVQSHSVIHTLLTSSPPNPNRTAASQNCIQLLQNSLYRISSSRDALLFGRLQDAVAWMSASLHYTYACWSGLSYTNDIPQVSQAMSYLNSTAITYSSISLSMILALHLHGDDTSLWTPPQTERSGFWPHPETPHPGPFQGGFPSKLTVSATVCKEEGRGCYSTVQKAVNAIPDQKVEMYVIRIAEGVYEETVRVPLEKCNVVFLGDGVGKTVITGSLNAGLLGLSTYNTATLGVAGDKFMMRGVTVRNTAGPNAHQAVAFLSDSDRSVIEDCEFLGNQDTLYAQTLRQYYKSCRIEGNVDFIFGNSAAIFDSCTILVRPRQFNPNKGETNAVAAHGRVDPAQATGFVFHGCIVNGTDEYMDLYFANKKAHRNYLGRPWKEYSRTVFLNCSFGPIVSAGGWFPWKGGFALKTLYYGEFGNVGVGANRIGRVPWSSEIPADHVDVYSVENFIQGRQWIPSTRSTTLL